ncbi:ribosome-binding factor A [Solirubrum puertoriconensis]|uniref:Ribosome-binding factor A n=1 Tax=Solirubrum puertoriconensis TaxID=1751427 RepID=A0A9X0HHG0_SOLP1|nr:ribosome-binding factor A [Solirubrum puertoriconensis]KUG05935.1 ribosome-binding factor A [Solirubrum puertoriconensis]
MESKRQQKFASLLTKELAEVFRRDLPHLFAGTLPPSITAVRVSPDLGVARIYLSVLLASDPKSQVAAVQEHTKEVRLALAKRVRNQLRVIPDLQFFLDDSAAYATHMDKVLSDLNIPPAPPEDEDDKPQRPRLFADED